MYTPKPFEVSDLATLHEFLAANSFATLITASDDGPFASHLPFVLTADAGSFGTLRTHMARANPQWRQFEADSEALAVFQGPHAYISPTWYETELSVPTWNYMVVHAYGRARVTDNAELHGILEASVSLYDPSWSLARLPGEFVAKLETAIVGVEIEITRLEGKFKMSQNRSPADRIGVVAGLRTSDDPLAAMVAAWMEERL